ncbi:alpha/beta fold hydrolase [Streptomyces sp. NPDC002490]|uniref:alpha/beta fold hydrolase n=1 Tax=Streptomyces sp. NPDC002490 TaxID=3154416 RepID=UPI00332C28A1
MSLWTDLLGAQVEHVDADGTPTRAVSLGTGPAVLFLHGRGGHLESFARNLAAVAAQGRRAIAVDLLGHGLTGRSTEGRYTVRELTDHVRAVLDAFDLAEADLVGQSLGGWVAALTALEAPGRVRRLALIEPAGLQSEAERLSDDAVRAAYRRGGRAYEEPTADAVRARLGGLLADPTTVDEELVELRTRLYGPPAARDVHRRVRAADNTPWLLTEERLAHLSVPTLFLRGESGHTPPDVVEVAARAVPDAVTVTVPGAKQWPQFERPRQVNELLNRFLAEGSTDVVLD